MFRAPDTNAQEKKEEGPQEIFSFTTPSDDPWSLNASNWNRRVKSFIRGRNVEEDPVSLASTKHLSVETNIPRITLSESSPTVQCDSFSLSLFISLPVVFNEDVFRGRARACFGNAVIHEDTQGHVQELFDGGLQMDRISEVELVRWSLVHPVVCTKGFAQLKCIPICDSIININK